MTRSKTAPRAPGGWQLFAYAALAIFAANLGTLALFGTGEAGIRAVVRLTARISVVLFSLAFVTSSIARRWPNPTTRWLLVNRRYIGVSFAFSHLLHLIALVALYDISEEFRANLSVVTIVAGGLAYAFIALMTATSFDRTARWIGPGPWRALHRVGAYYIWVIFAQSYIPRALLSAAYAPLALLLIAAMALRLSARKRTIR